MFDSYPGRALSKGRAGILEQHRIFRPKDGLGSIEANGEQSVAMNVVAGRTPLHVGGLSDEDLVALARHGNEQAFDAIVHRYRGPLVSYCRRWVDAHRAEEVVQHTLMKAFICLRDDDRPLALRPWLYRVAHNAALNALEKKGSDWEQLDENYDGVPQPPQVAEQRARFLSVVGEIEALPTRQREALLLNEFEGRCYAEIATELGTSESGVRGLLRRARRQLRETAAAVLLPFPALRELVRSDGVRTLQVDRAGELVGSAGAVGGVGAAGGLTKVAAGVLAAGTIAGGGTAIEQRDGGWRVQSPDVAEAAEPQPVQPGAQAGGDRRTIVTATAGGEDGTAVMSRLAFSGGQLIPAARLPVPADDGYSWRPGGIEGHQQQESGAGDPEPDPIVPADPALPVPGEPKEEPADEEKPPADEEKDAEPKESDSTDRPGAGDEPTAGDDGTSDGEEAANPPATPAAPVTPHRF
jgi:RNA polymerase sigma factor (sigma-70 family)